MKAILEFDLDYPTGVDKIDSF